MLLFDEISLVESHNEKGMWLTVMWCLSSFDMTKEEANKIYRSTKNIFVSLWYRIWNLNPIHGCFFCVCWYCQWVLRGRVTMLLNRMPRKKCLVAKRIAAKKQHLAALRVTRTLKVVMAIVATLLAIVLFRCTPLWLFMCLAGMYPIAKRMFNPSGTMFQTFQNPSTFLFGNRQR